MLISEKQILKLMNVARFVTLNWSIENGEIHAFTLKLITEIEEQQSEELKEIS